MGKTIRNTRFGPVHPAQCSKWIRGAYVIDPGAGERRRERERGEEEV